ncbi:MAG: YybH family protein [Candidatus Acidiferrales bacterium]
MKNADRNWVVIAAIAILALAMGAVNAAVPRNAFAVSTSGDRLAAAGANASASAAPQAGGIAEVGQVWSKEWSAGHLEETLALYTPDAVFFTGEGGRVAGQAAIRNLFQHWIDASTATIQLHSLGSESSGNLAYDSGDYTETIVLKTAMGSAPAGTKTSDHGSYLLVLKRQPNGKWLIAQHMWTEAPPDSK